MKPARTFPILAAFRALGPSGAYCVALCLGLILASFAHGLSTGRMAVMSSLHSVVICAEMGGEATVVLNAKGEAVDPDQMAKCQTCPDCVQLGVTALLLSPFAPLRAHPLPQPRQLTAQNSTIPAHWLPMPARGPPLEV